MSHSAPRASSPDATRIDIANAQELLDWAERLDVPPASISDAVAQVGDDAEAVELVLKGTVQTACGGHH